MDPRSAGLRFVGPPLVGLLEALERIASNGTALTSTFDHEHTSVDRSSLGGQLGQVLETGQYPDVVGAC